MSTWTAILHYAGWLWLPVAVEMWRKTISGWFGRTEFGVSVALFGWRHAVWSWLTTP